MAEEKGLRRAAEIYADRFRAARELKEKGHKIAGYFCCYVPVELLSAAGFVPMRILGDMGEPVTVADTYLPTMMCPFFRSCLDLGLKGRYDFLDAFVGVHACDGAERVSAVWRSYLQYPCVFYLDTPHTAHDHALVFFQKQLGYLQAVLEEHTGRKISGAAVKEQISLYNRQRRLVRELYKLRQVDPPPVSGTEVLQVAVALLQLPVQEGNRLVEDVIAEVKARRPGPAPKKSRLLVSGCLIDNIAITGLIEECGLRVVMDDTAIGSRTFGHDVEPTPDPLKGLADRYLAKIVCPRTFRETGKSRAEDLEQRYAYLKSFIQDWKVDGVYLNLIRNCDIHGYEIPELKHYLEGLGVPVLAVEQDYSTAGLAPLRTRFQAFAETMEID
ncbi:MAG: 2-hydroxyacyl-CoA dehydratase family protein [Peptococcaceae bacterium]|jgi:bcr-type benzoyl-CoA reductase subunit C|nr:2-hydroxyacyl-CoA dehydratase family protein [Peptococcaceae bacterium]